MPLVQCPECAKEISQSAKLCPSCGCDMYKSKPENDICTINPKMFRNSPIWFSICILLCLLYGLGLIILFVWWVKTKCTTLTITNKRTILKHGIVSKKTNEVRHCDVRNVRISQNFSERILKVGKLEVSCSGQSDIEISVSGILDPDKQADIIRNNQ